jgi:hypothetical protein
MANTYYLIGSSTVSGSSTAVVTFSSLGAYTDIVIWGSARGGGSTDYTNINVTVNGDTASNYKYVRFLEGRNTTVSTNFAASLAYVYAYGTGATDPANIFATNKIEIKSYTNTTTRKTIAAENYISGFSTVSGYMESQCGTYDPSANTAITSITLTCREPYFTAGTNFQLYGIKNT